MRKIKEMEEDIYNGAWKGVNFIIKKGQINHGCERGKEDGSSKHCTLHAACIFPCKFPLCTRIDMITKYVVSSVTSLKYESS